MSTKEKKDAPAVETPKEQKFPISSFEKIHRKLGMSDIEFAAVSRNMKGEYTLKEIQNAVAAWKRARVK